VNPDASRLCIHTITNNPWSARECIDNYAREGVAGITFWRKDFEDEKPAAIGQAARDAGLEVVSVARGGFFCAESTLRRQALLNDNIEAIGQTAEAGAPVLVLVCGSDPGQSLPTSRDQILAGLEHILPRAADAGVKLAIEPLHPMYADDRSAINTMRTANALCDRLGSPEQLGIAVDVYHTWWDPDLEAEIRTAGEKNRLFAFHICDWKSPTTDILNDRGLMGEGCIDIAEIRRWMRKGGFNGFDEVEIFSDRYWAEDQSAFLARTLPAYHAIA
jgi:sugar phosphate isomerase/epimerase